ncbi:hypothetical protein L1887_51832 [Cichorium endivia]|nr:hypothetical protein L1887_51832 [Cichorium endivia]
MARPIGCLFGTLLLGSGGFCGGFGWELLASTFCPGIERKVQRKDAEFQHDDPDVTALESELISHPSLLLWDAWDLLCGSDAIEFSLEHEAEQAKHSACTVDCQKPQTDSLDLPPSPDLVVLGAPLAQEVKRRFESACYCTRHDACCDALAQRNPVRVVPALRHGDDGERREELRLDDEGDVDVLHHKVRALRNGSGHPDQQQPRREAVGVLAPMRLDDLWHQLERPKHRPDRTQYTMPPSLRLSVASFEEWKMERGNLLFSNCIHGHRPRRSSLLQDGGEQANGRHWIGPGKSGYAGGAKFAQPRVASCRVSPTTPRRLSRKTAETCCWLDKGMRGECRPTEPDEVSPRGPTAPLHKPRLAGVGFGEPVGQELHPQLSPTAASLALLAHMPRESQGKRLLRIRTMKVLSLVSAFVSAGVLVHAAVFERAATADADPLARLDELRLQLQRLISARIVIGHEIALAKFESNPQAYCSILKKTPVSEKELVQQITDEKQQVNVLGRVQQKAKDMTKLYRQDQKYPEGTEDQVLRLFQAYIIPLTTNVEVVTLLDQAKNCK